MDGIPLSSLDLFVKMEGKKTRYIIDGLIASVIILIGVIAATIF
jgi:hypothetical protein